MPDGRPDSVNVTVYLTRENATDSETEAPSTAREPEDGEGLYALSFVDINYNIYLTHANGNVSVIFNNTCIGEFKAGNLLFEAFIDIFIINVLFFITRMLE